MAMEKTNEIIVVDKNGLTQEQKTEEELIHALDQISIDSWMKDWFLNSVENYSIIPKDRPKTINQLRNIHEGEEAVILASGPSLDETIPYLKKFKGRIFATNSTVNPCIANGVTPDWVVNLDADKYVANQFKDINTGKLKVILATYCHSSLIKLFSPNLIWWFVIFDDRHWFLYGGQHILFPSIDGLLASTCASGAACRLAWLMGIKKMYLLGFDFSYPKGKNRCIHYIKEKGIWTPNGIDEYCLDRSEQKIVRGKKTSVKLEVTHAAISKMIKSLPGIEVIDCSKGIMYGFQKMDFRKVVESQ